ncbi:MAG: hypothetical protein OEV55_06975 [candidate division Zixibacteria bacterium]|nr:hypothetical protein [candidate division Zixibacteria bacterium]
MTHEFKKPNFTKGDLEFRFENQIVCIYGTKEGLENLISVIQKLTKNPSQGHVHLENEACGLLTEESENGAIAIFTKE